MQNDPSGADSEAMRFRQIAKQHYDAIMSLEHPINEARHYASILEKLLIFHLDSIEPATIALDRNDVADILWLSEKAASCAADLDAAHLGYLNVAIEIGNEAETEAGR